MLKIHGDISTPHDIVLTKTDYDNYFQKRPAVSTLLKGNAHDHNFFNTQKGLLLNRTFLFVGYSLRDLNLQIILNEVSSLLKDAKRPAYAVVFEATQAEIQHWKDQGIIPRFETRLI